ncbi:hypothetical protein Lalb_Chr23g0273451 [Lupinus albus]|uniref:Uncharacterized protein n=1 Tax=Lupinus albus TaxID=3870 RepID=A0A6A4NC72_LUPAL|nr:hypothetical protein Lalb_Chr23g0273451 [Lupinus albus]
MAALTAEGQRRKAAAATWPWVRVATRTNPSRAKGSSDGAILNREELSSLEPNRSQLLPRRITPLLIWMFIPYHLSSSIQIGKGMKSLTIIFFISPRRSDCRMNSDWNLLLFSLLIIYGPLIAHFDAYHCCPTNQHITDS